MEETEKIIEQIQKPLNQWLGKYRNEKVRIGNIYYAGGTLCIDVMRQQPGEVFGLIMLNISDETYTVIKDGKERRFLLDLYSLEMIFKIYLALKGKTPYYLECYQKSCLRHMFDTNMQRWEPMSKPLIDKYLWEAGITGGKTAKEIGEELSKWKRKNQI